MTLAALLQHWSLLENPFRGEEARQDPVFSRLAALDDVPGAAPAPHPPVRHPDFEKIAGDFTTPSTAIVFGEKGSGKTAIRLQLAQRIAAHNADNPGRRVMLLAHDHLADMLDRYVARVRPTLRDRKATPGDALKRFRLADHIDGVLSLAAPQLVDAILQQPGHAACMDLGPEVKRRVRALDLSLRHDLLALQAVYDHPEHAPARTRALQRRLGVRRSWIDRLESLWVALGWLAPAAVLEEYIRTGRLRGLSPASLGAHDDQGRLAILSRFPELDPMWTTAFFTALGVWLLFLFKRAITDRFVVGRLAARLRRQVRVSTRPDASYAQSLRTLPAAVRALVANGLAERDDQHASMLQRLRRVLASLGYTGIVIVVDRVDEPPVIAGDPERMRSVVWPLLTNQFLQQEGIGIKLLLPVELRHVLFRESAAFFQEARLDKQGLVERLAWSGPLLYDLCTARLNACRAPGTEPLTLTDLFGEGVSRQDLVEALEQMHQPRDAFKFLYQCLADHCAAVTADEAAFKVPTATLEAVRRQQAERVRQLAMGVRPA